MCTGSVSELQKVTDGEHTTLVGLLMFNSDCNLSHPAVQSKPQFESPTIAGEASGFQ